ncbi:carbamate kinase [Alkalibacterium putridalgicola]|jgi:carbamate kinase|uniref:Carbamate kinase n=1 Tax=Alkalibacterium putridalgicola TaxID=426703 RepID=A0A1H7USU8_9LACT|nr:carbamate kinase [Alkalibacterium putridalgicola]GEK88489.1 carbamate kinase-like protein YqeA [Alkalibacterium putridalgicola]SEM00062.1 carbamate kinase [Alkalibacterium putridalgicola]
MSKILIALGGNALGENAEEQRKLAKNAAAAITDMIEQGHEVILSHGNGPQVGAINLAFQEYAKAKSNESLSMPFPECGAMSQGYIGYHLQNALRTELLNRGINKSVVSLVTQVVVDSKDEAFKNPTKPIGPFYSKAESEELADKTGDTYIEDSGRGYRKVIPSPAPVKVVESAMMKELIDNGHIVIGAGGGGIPVIEGENNQLIGVEAVIDKDNASEKLAEELDVDFFFILTAVDRVAVNFGKPSQKELESLSIEEAKQYIEEGHFPAGSMLPKVQAAMKFVESKHGRKSIISSLEKAKEAVLGKTGTVVHK